MEGSAKFIEREGQGQGKIKATYAHPYATAGESDMQAASGKQKRAAWSRDRKAALLAVTRES